MDLTLGDIHPAFCFDWKQADWGHLESLTKCPSLPLRNLEGKDFESSFKYSCHIQHPHDTAHQKKHLGTFALVDNKVEMDTIPICN